MMLLVFVTFTSTLTLPFALSLDLDTMEEGTCAGLNDGMFPTKELINMTWFDSINVWYLSAGSKYDLTRITLHHFNDDVDKLKSLAEKELIRNACFKVEMESENAQVIGFEGEISNYKLRSMTYGVIESTFVSTSGQVDVCRYSITLTDNKSFVFFANCFVGADQVGWDLFTTSETLHRQTREMIINHAIGLGFDKEKFVFLKYHGKCRKSPKEL